MTEGSQEFCLRWNNHQATIISVFDYLLENETLVDCTLAAEGQYLKAHKVVLCACSPYLELLLSQHNDKHPILIFKDIKFNELKSMIDYMYKGEVNIAQDQLNHFLKAAESLQIKGLSESEEESTTQTAAPTPRPPPPRAPPVQRTQPRPISNAVAVRSSDVVDLPESPKRINRNDAASPSRKRRRQVVPVQGRPSLSGDDASNASEGHLDQSNCDVPSNTSLQSSENAVAKVETNSELMLEPKTEYDDNSVEDITLDDDEEDYSQAGTSQMDNSQMNFSGWQQMVGDKSTDDVFAGQDTGAQNSQDLECRGCEDKEPILGFDNSSMRNIVKHCKSCPKLPRFDPSRPYSCLRCSYSCTRAYNMIQHLRRHIGKTFYCATCSKKFTTMFSLKMHLKSHTGNNYECPLCKQKENSKPELYEHYVKRHGVDKSCKKCPYCSKLFKRIDSFQRHLVKDHGHPASRKSKTIKIVFPNKKKKNKSNPGNLNNPERTNNLLLKIEDINDSD